MAGGSMIVAARHPTLRPAAPSGASCRRGRKSRAACRVVSSQEEREPAAQGAGPAPDLPLSRRQLQLLALGACASLAASPQAQAVGFKKELKRRKIPIEEYSTSEDGLKFYDLAEGRGEAVQPGSRVTVHFDCKYRGIDAVSTRSARTLGGNRTVAEPFEFTAGEAVSNKAKKINDSAGGLFAGVGGPKPPAALSTAVLGMKAGGTRSVIVPPELGYGDRGEQEIPPNESFELLIEVLKVGA